VYGDQRVDKRGRSSANVVLNNIQKLIDNQIDFGAICVLNKNTRKVVKQIFRFFDELGIAFRFLPFFETRLQWQANLNALSNQEIADALIEVFEEWLISDRATTLAPLEECMAIAIWSMTNKMRPHFDREVDETVFVVNTDGRLWGQSEVYQPEFTYGNIFDNDLRKLLLAPSRQEAVAVSRRRQEASCSNCPYYGPCSGYYVSSNPAYEPSPSAQWRCVVRDVVAHMVDRLSHSEIADIIVGDIAKERPNQALFVDL
jgi:uncharacterized protein